jgi:hypothetical protein
MRVPVEQLIDLSNLGTSERGPTPREIREALPRGWVLEEDGVTARSDARLLFKEGWVLIAGLVVFGAAAIALFWTTLPHGASGWLRLAILIAVLLVAGGIVGPIVTRALNRR